VFKNQIIILNATLPPSDNREVLNTSNAIFVQTIKHLVQLS